MQWFLLPVRNVAAEMEGTARVRQDNEVGRGQLMLHKTGMFMPVPSFPYPSSGLITLLLQVTQQTKLHIFHLPLHHAAQAVYPRGPGFQCCGFARLRYVIEVVTSPRYHRLIASPGAPQSDEVKREGASLEAVETAAWYNWDKKRDAEEKDGASLEDIETAAWYGWTKKRELEKKEGASLEDIETAAWYGWTKRD
jgi:hypothetical protein